MSKKVTYSIVALLILLIAGVVAMNVLQYRDLQRIRKEFLSPKPQQADGTAPLQTEETVIQPEKSDVNGGHTHPDGTFHAEEHPPYTPTPVQIPDNITDPAVAAAWERLDYISKNIWEWGGQPSLRAAELINQLMPPPDGFVGTNAHNDAEVVDQLISKLAKYRDPRAAAVFVTYYCNGIMMGTDMEDALVEIGPPSVPLLIPYLVPSSKAGIFAASRILPRIVDQNRSEFNGVVEHIIIPRLEAIISGDNIKRSIKVDAQKAFSRLKK